jgi:hypothetical protein
MLFVRHVGITDIQNKFYKKTCREKKLGLKIMTLSWNWKNFFKFNNNELNSLQRYGIAQNYRIVHRVGQRFISQKESCHVYNKIKKPKKWG